MTKWEKQKETVKNKFLLKIIQGVALRSRDEILLPIEIIEHLTGKDYNEKDITLIYGKKVKGY